eukprot:TRINITY_DN9620_c0_g1_i1.p1 TRINITY_DN9620_c0_g1~~TRINITY_DN9620_c0_g1_i1.p1  ORF type:complete len:215 (+),score=48.45 TRINITY_DN9620_c0_g1_i1:52-645(+)
MTFTKCITIGNVGTGKTSLITKFCEGTYPPTQTIGKPFYQITFHDEGVSKVVEFWDTLGHENYSFDLPDFFFKDAQIALVCFTLVDKEAFEDAFKWATLCLKRFKTNPPILLFIGTCLDEILDGKKKREIARREILEKIQHFANRNGVLCEFGGELSSSRQLGFDNLKSSLKQCLKVIESQFSHVEIVEEDAKCKIM